MVQPPLDNTVEIKLQIEIGKFDAGWSSLVARRAHNPKVAGSNPAPATNLKKDSGLIPSPFLFAQKNEPAPDSPPDWDASPLWNLKAHGDAGVQPRSVVIQF